MTVGPTVMSTSRVSTPWALRASTSRWPRDSTALASTSWVAERASPLAVGRVQDEPAVAGPSSMVSCSPVAGSTAAAFFLRRRFGTDSSAGAGSPSSCAASGAGSGSGSGSSSGRGAGAGAWKTGASGSPGGVIRLPRPSRNARPTGRRPRTVPAAACRTVVRVTTARPTSTRPTSRSTAPQVATAASRPPPTPRPSRPPAPPRASAPSSMPGVPRPRWKSPVSPARNNTPPTGIRLVISPNSWRSRNMAKPSRTMATGSTSLVSPTVQLAASSTTRPTMPARSK